MSHGETFPGLFLDRDGIINIDSGFVWRKEEFVFQDCIFEICNHFKKKGFKLVIITNQSGIGRGLFSLDEFYSLSDWMLSCFEKEGCAIDLLLASALDPTYISASSREKRFRKPAPGMLFAAKEILNLDLRNSLLIGDRKSDIDAGFNAGIRNLFLVNPRVSSGEYSESFESLHHCLVRLKSIF